MANKVKFGLSNCHYAIATVATNGSVTWGAWKELPLAVSLTADVNSNTSDQYADNVLVYSHTSTTGASVTIEFSSLSDEFKKDVLGYIESTDGAILQPVNNIKQKIAFGFEFEGDESKSIRVYFLCSVADNANDGANTNNENVTFQNEQVVLTAYPIALASGDMVLKETLEKTDSGYSGFWGKALTLPTKKSS